LAPLLLTATPASAASLSKAGAIDAKLPQTTYTFDTAGGPMAGAIEIAAKGSNWFKFKYHYDNKGTSENSNDNADPTQALVQLKTAAIDCLAFDVWTQDRLQNPQHKEQDKNSKNDKVAPIGSGTPLFKNSVMEEHVKKDVVDAQTLTWSGSAATSDTYYIVVKNRSNVACSYSLSISGPDVSF
jgi:hypothetical protein